LIRMLLSRCSWLFLRPSLLRSPCGARGCLRLTSRMDCLMPRDEAWWASSHSDHARAVANASTGRFLAVVPAGGDLCPPSSLSERSGTLLSVQTLECAGRDNRGSDRGHYFTPRDYIIGTGRMLRKPPVSCGSEMTKARGHGQFRLLIQKTTVSSDVSL
jgi:hypothetical protein